MTCRISTFRPALFGVALAGLLLPGAHRLAAQAPDPAQPAQETEPASEAPEAPEVGGVFPALSFHFEARTNYRNSQRSERFGSPFFTTQTPPVPVFEETVSPGSHFEVSVVSLFADAVWSDDLSAHAKIDFIDLYDRNPTSSDKKVDIDEIWLRFGKEADPATLPDGFGAYFKVGKFPHFERQDDRHLESYGLVSTAFNRFEDAGAELGVDLGRHLYIKVSATQGNPVFFRDPNALAGDNGTPEFEKPTPPLPNPALKSGIVLLYDAEVEDLDADGDLELGGGLGVRFADAGGQNGVDALVWGYQRKLADTVDLEGTFYGGDLDLFSVGPAPNFLPIEGDEKREVGANLWVYWGGLSFFGQAVDQEIAGLGRTAFEGELAWRFDLPLVLAVGGKQLFPYIAPAVRFSKIDNDFANRPASVAPTPIPSLAWDWEKIDAGVRLGILAAIDLTVEYADNRFIIGNGTEHENNEFLGTLRWRI